MHKSEVTCFWDLIRYLLIITSTIIITYFLWTKVHWLLAVVFVIPVYIVMLNLFGFLTLPLYYFTPERRTASNTMDAIEKGDIDTALKIVEGYENDEVTLSNDDLDNATAEVSTRKKG